MKKENCFIADFKFLYFPINVCPGKANGYERYEQDT